MPREYYQKGDSRGGASMKTMKNKAITAYFPVILALLLCGCQIGQNYREEKMADAIRKGDLSKVKALLSSEPGLLQRCGDGVPLQMAARFGQKEIAGFLIARGADINSNMCGPGYTPLHWAVIYDNVEVVELLVKKGAKVDMKDIEGRTPLHWSAAMTSRPRSYRRITGLLIDNGADSNLTDNDGSTPVIVALKDYDNLQGIDTAKLLMQKGAGVTARDHRGATALHHAAMSTCRRDDVRHLISQLISKGADINARDMDGLTPLNYALDCGQKDIAVFLHRHGASVTIFDAVRMGDTKRVTRFISKNPSLVRSVYGSLAPGAQGNSSRRAPAKSGPAGTTALHLLLSCNNGPGGNEQWDMLRLLVAHGAPINQKDALGNTPLHLAVLCDPKAVSCLLSKGADIEAKNDSGATPLHRAAASDKDITALLIQKGADVNARDNSFNTPLLVATETGKTEIMKLLVEKGADVNVMSHYGVTPLYYTVGRGDQREVELLLSHGANPDLAGKPEYRPVSLASDMGRKDLIEMLKAHGAQWSAVSELKSKIRL